MEAVDTAKWLQGTVPTTITLRFLSTMLRVEVSPPTPVGQPFLSLTVSAVAMVVFVHSEPGIVSWYLAHDDCTCTVPLPATPLL
jgi:hypothetical protein